MQLDLKPRMRRTPNANKEIRETLYKTGVCQWQLADALNYSHAYFCAKLRHEFTAAEKEKCLQIIQDIAKSK